LQLVQQEQNAASEKIRQLGAIQSSLLHSPQQLIGISFGGWPQHRQRETELWQYKLITELNRIKNEASGTNSNPFGHHPLAFPPLVATATSKKKK
jgi:hypothetical protein